MPVAQVQVPHGVFDEHAVERCIAGLTDALAHAEQIPDDPARRTGIVVTWQELERGALRSNAVDPTPLAVPVLVWVHPPEGVLDGASAARLVDDVQRVFAAAAPADGRPVVTSVVVREVADGWWGIGGVVNHLPDFAARAGYAHLQHLVP